MSQSTPKMRRLANELRMMNELKQESSLVEFTADPADYPNQYRVTFNCLGLAYKPDFSGPPPANWRQLSYPWLRREHTALIYLPAQYPDQPPRITLETPLFHPNTTSQKEIQRTLAAIVERLGGQERFERLLSVSPELQENVARISQMGVCVDGIILPQDRGNYHLGLHVSDICVELGQMIMLQRYNLAHGLNDEALDWIRWAEKQSGLLPVDLREFLDKRDIIVQVLEGGEELEISLLSEESA